MGTGNYSAWFKRDAVTQIRVRGWLSFAFWLIRRMPGAIGWLAILALPT